MGFNKKRKLQRHARRRCQQRYGVSLTEERRRRILRDIENGAARLVERQSRRVSVWWVQLAEAVEAPVVYDGERQEIVTVLPKQPNAPEGAERSTA